MYAGRRLDHMHKNDNNDDDRTGTGVDTPCTGVCKIDTLNRLCIGCARSIDEITAWSRMAPADRRAIMAGLAARRANATWSVPTDVREPAGTDDGDRRT